MIWYYGTSHRSSSTTSSHRAPISSDFLQLLIRGQITPCSNPRHYGAWGRIPSMPLRPDLHTNTWLILTFFYSLIDFISIKTTSRIILWYLIFVVRMRDRLFDWDWSDSLRFISCSDRLIFRSNSHATLPSLVAKHMSLLSPQTNTIHNQPLHHFHSDCTHTQSSFLTCIHSDSIITPKYCNLQTPPDPKSHAKSSWARELSIAQFVRISHGLVGKHRWGAAISFPTRNHTHTRALFAWPPYCHLTHGDQSPTSPRHCASLLSSCCKMRVLLFSISAVPFAYPFYGYKYFNRIKKNKYPPTNIVHA